MKKIEGTREAWEAETIGASPEFAEKAPDGVGQQVDDSLGLQMISIRLPVSLIKEFKNIADYRGLGYQPLMRIALQRFAEGEKRLILKEVAEQVRQSAQNLAAPKRSPAQKPQKKAA